MDEWGSHTSNEIFVYTEITYILATHSIHLKNMLVFQSNTF